MRTSEAPESRPSERARIPRWIRPVLLIPLGLGVHVVLPWAISLIAPRYGWSDGRPGLWNVIGLVPVAVGLAMITWGLSLHFVRGTGVVEWEGTPRDLLLRGPYLFSRNPMYLLELAMWFGWTIFYGSVAIFIAFILWWVFFAFLQIPTEERQLEARFGETYLKYKDTVPRWIGLPRRR